MSGMPEDPTIETKLNKAYSVCPAVMEACALGLLVLAGFSVDLLQSNAIAVYVLFLAAAVVITITGRARSRVATLGFPLFFMYAYAHIDTARLAIRIPGDPPIGVPLAVVILAVMICLFVITLLFGSAGGSIGKEPARSVIAAVVFVSVLSGALYIMDRSGKTSDGRMLRDVIGKAVSQGLIFIIVNDLLSRPGVAERFNRYAMAFSAVAVLVAVVS